MRGEASLSADHESRNSLAPDLKAAGLDALRVGKELFVVCDLFDHNVQVERSLTDLSRPTADKVRLLQGIVGEQAHPVTMKVLADLVSRRWSRVADIANAVEDFAVDALMYYADATDSTVQVSVELAQIESALLQMPVLGSKLGDDSVPAKARLDLLHGSFNSGDFNKTTLLLAEHVAANPRRRSFPVSLQWLIGRFSWHMGESMVTVTTAVPLSGEQIDRLTKTYSAKLGHQVHINSVVDPSVLGGMKVQAGSEVTDKTVIAQLGKLRRNVRTQM